MKIKVNNFKFITKVKCCYTWAAIHFTVFMNYFYCKVFMLFSKAKYVDKLTSFYSILLKTLVTNHPNPRMIILGISSDS